MTHSGDPVGVVGGGLGGLAAACTLAARGHRVILLERNAWLGGKAAVLEANGYRFDMGPTILTVPSVLRRIFAEAGRDVEDALQLMPLEPQWRCFFDDDSTLDLCADMQGMTRELDRLDQSGALARGYEHLMDFARNGHGITERYFFWRSVDSMADIVAVAPGLKLALLSDLIRIRPWQTVASMVRKHLRDPRAAQMADHFTQYVGSSPFSSPAVLCSIAHMQTDEGVWYPKGGIGAVPRALAQLAEDLGVEVRTNCGVRRVLVEGQRVSGVETDGGQVIGLSAVVANSDAETTYTMMERTKAAEQIRRRWPERACSGVVLYLGLDHSPDHLLHHNFVFSRDAEEEFDAIYKRGQPAPDPTCYVCAPGRTEPDAAPEGCESIYVLVHAPHLRPSHDWGQLWPDYRRSILRKLETAAGLEDLESHVVFESVLTPSDIERRYAAPAGAIYGFASHGRLTGAFKSGNRREDVQGLYLAGGSAHPGPGMPMVMMSGWIAADALDKAGVASRST